MNPEYEKKLEASVRRELESLDELKAPDALAARIMAAVMPDRTPWYARAWTTWTPALRLASATVLLLAFAGLCFGTWELTRTVAATETAGSYLADAKALWRTAGVLGGVVQTLINQVGTPVILTGLVMLFTAAAASIGLGSACFRLAQKRQLI